MNDSLPPGQRSRPDFPRFGLTQYASRFPGNPDQKELQVSGDVFNSHVIAAPFDGLAHTEQTSDFHCVTTWTRRSLRWGGVRFVDFYRSKIEPSIDKSRAVNVVVFRGQDGYRSTLPLSDLLAEEVLLADHLDGEPLSVDHGAPMRLIAPAHYGYKSVKHLSRIEFWQSEPAVRPAAFAFMDHPRARVAYEERGRWLPGWILRHAYRPLIGITAARFAKATNPNNVTRRKQP